MVQSPLPFEWKPGQGFDQMALGRLQEAFQRPDQPMGEAWFMGERLMFPELLGDLGQIHIERLQRAFTEIGSGTGSFGPHEEWRTWFHYLLPRSIPRSHETCVFALLEALITAFISQYPGGLEDEPCPGFRADVLNTLGRCLMDPACWPGGSLHPETCLNKYYVQRRGIWLWDQASGPLSASMFFCLKYLRPEEVAPWITSAFRIEPPYWRAQLMVWLLGAHGVLTGKVKQPSDFLLSDDPSIDWDWSHCLSGDYSGLHGGNGVTHEFLPAENRLRALEAIARHFSEALFLEWLEAISEHPSLESELAAKPHWFYELYKANA